MKLLKDRRAGAEVLFWMSILAVFGVALLNQGGIGKLGHLAYLLMWPVMAFFVLWFKKFYWRPEFWVLLIFMFLMLMSWGLSETANVGLKAMIAYGGLVLTYGLVAGSEWEVKWRDAFLRIVGVTWVVLCLIGIGMYLLLPFNRLTSVFIDLNYNFIAFPNAFANFSLLVLPIVIYWYFKVEEKWQKVLWGLGIIIGVMALVLTFSRGAMLALLGVTILSSILFGWKKIWQQKVNVLVLSALVIGGLVVAAGLNYYYGQVDEQANSLVEKATLQADEKSVSTDSRVDFWMASLRLADDEPWTGYGPDSFRYVFPSEQMKFLNLADHPHNFLLKILVENGVLALIALLGFLGMVLWKYWRSKKFGGLELALFVGAMGSLLHNLVDYNLNFVINMMLTTVWLGLLGSMLGGERKDPGLGGKVILQSILVLIGVLGLFEVYQTWLIRWVNPLMGEGRYQEAALAMQEAEGIVLKEDYYLQLAEIYWEVYEEEGSEDSLVKVEKWLVDGISLNQYDAALKNRLGDVYFERGDIELAERYYTEAWRLDSQNRLEYFYDQMRVDGELSEEEFDSAKTLLADYNYELARNSYLTVLTENPRFAELTYLWILEIREDDEMKDGLMLLKEIDQLERAKFSDRYGFIFNEKEDV